MQFRRMWRASDGTLVQGSRRRACVLPVLHAAMPKLSKVDPPGSRRGGVLQSCLSLQLSEDTAEASRVMFEEL